MMKVGVFCNISALQISLCSALTVKNDKKTKNYFGQGRLQNQNGKSQKPSKAEEIAKRLAEKEKAKRDIAERDILLEQGVQNIKSNYLRNDAENARYAFINAYEDLKQFVSNQGEAQKLLQEKAKEKFNLVFNDFVVDVDNYGIEGIQNQYDYLLLEGKALLRIRAGPEDNIEENPLWKHFVEKMNKKKKRLELIKARHDQIVKDILADVKDTTNIDKLFETRESFYRVQNLFSPEEQNYFDTMYAVTWDSIIKQLFTHLENAEQQDDLDSRHAYGLYVFEKLWIPERCREQKAEFERIYQEKKEYIKGGCHSETTSDASSTGRLSPRSPFSDN